MERGELASLKLRLKNPNSRDMVEVARRMQAMGAACPHDLVKCFLESVRQGIHPDWDTLAELVCSLRDRGLYIAARDVLLSASAWEHIKLLRAGIADPEIEQRLCQHLYKYHDGTDVSRAAIVKV